LITLEAPDYELALARCCAMELNVARRAHAVLSTATSAFASLLLLTACADVKDVAPISTSRCTECDVVLGQVGTLSDSVDPGALPDYMVHAMRDARGRTYVISRKKNSVLVFDSTGALIRRLGKSGSGPGVYGTIRRVLPGPSDSLFVADWGIGRLTVYSPDLAVARTQTIQHQPDLVLADGSFVIAEQIGKAQLVGYPIHRATSDGAITRSFGADTPQYRPDLRLITTRWVANARNGGIWTVAPGRYRIEHWDALSGQRTRAIDVKSEWFKEIAAWPDDESTRPPAVIETLWEDASGIIWVLLRDADLNWRAPPQAGTERRITADEYEKTYDWIVEAVDPTSGSVVASKRFAHILWGRPGSTVLVSAKSIRATQSTYDVWQPRLTPKGGSE
jgi:hypothetical protein